MEPPILAKEQKITVLVKERGYNPHGLTEQGVNSNKIRSSQESYASPQLVWVAPSISLSRYNVTFSILRDRARNVWSSAASSPCGPLEQQDSTCFSRFWKAFSKSFLRSNALPSNRSAIRFTTYARPSSNSCSAVTTGAGSSKPGSRTRYLHKASCVRNTIRNRECQRTNCLRKARFCWREGPNSNRRASASDLTSSKLLLIISRSEYVRPTATSGSFVTGSRASCASNRRLEINVLCISVAIGALQSRSNTSHIMDSPRPTPTIRSLAAVVNFCSC